MGKYVWGDQETKFFFELTPELILDTVSKHGFSVSGRCLVMNSMENRVYEVEVDGSDRERLNLENDFVIIKFYRPGRWNENQIRDEHDFLWELYDQEIPVIPPLKINQETLFKCLKTNLFYTLFPKKGGRAPDEMTTEQLEIMGRTLARLHNIGESKSARARIEISPHSFGIQNLNYLLDKKVIDAHLESDYERLVKEICEKSSDLFKNIKKFRVHGDCHLGNIISRGDEKLFLIDFDDMLIGPAVQDIWLVTPGRDEYDLQCRNILLEAYETMRPFNYGELKLVESLRSLRFIHFSAWIAKRWEDPAFQSAFPHFSERQYWEVQVNDLRTQLILINNIINPQDYY